jgi:hypothetical protein
MDEVLLIVKMKRLCIYPKDIQVITGRSERYGRGLIRKIKDHLDKEKHQLVTVEEFCQYMGMNQETVSSHIR